MSEVVILRVGHRPARDKRVSTHVGLVARAFGANGIIFAGNQSKSVRQSLENVTENWGGSFSVEENESWKSVIKEWQSSGGLVAHLTMYGLPVGDKISDLREKDLLIVVGAEKVPGEIYDLADFNIAIGNQPHSEISALAVFLDRLFKGKELEKEFPEAKRKIIPSDSGKNVVETDN